MKQAMERHERGESRVIPIILRPVYWQKAPFGKLQALPTDARPVTSSKWHTQDEAFFDVAEGIRVAIEELIAKDEAQQWKDQGNMLLNQKQYEKALVDFDRAISLNANDAWGFGGRGETYRQMGQYEKALADFKRAISLSTNFSQALAAHRKLAINSTQLKLEPPFTVEEVIARYETEQWMNQGVVPKSRVDKLPKESFLINAYEQVKAGKITSPDIIRRIAADFQRFDSVPEASFNGARAAHVLLARASMYEELVKAEQQFSGGFPYDVVDQYDDSVPATPNWTFRPPTDDNLIADG